MTHPTFHHRHLLTIDDLSLNDIHHILDLSQTYVEQNRRANKRSDVLLGRTQINLFFENSTRTQMTFELAGKRLGADVLNMDISSSSTAKGETATDTAMTLSAMNPDLLVIRHDEAGAVAKIAKKLSCAVINGGDGTNEHPTQALADALTIKRHFGKLEGLQIAICGDILHSRVARSNIKLFSMFGIKIHLIAPKNLLPKIKQDNIKCFEDMKQGLKDCDIVMMLRIQYERINKNALIKEWNIEGNKQKEIIHTETPEEGMFAKKVPTEKYYTPSSTTNNSLDTLLVKKRYFAQYGLTYEKLKHAKDTVRIMHPGPFNRDIEIDSTLVDDINYSLIPTQVEMGVAVRMAILDLLARNLPN